MQFYKPVWEPMNTAPKERDFLVRLRSGYISRARFVGQQSRALAFDSVGPSGSEHNDITAIAWTELPLFDEN